MSNMEVLYFNTIKALEDRIVKLIREYPELLYITNTSALLNFPEFQCDDLTPSYFQVSEAFYQARMVVMDD